MSLRWIDETTRTGLVRVEVDNRDGGLRPGQFVTGLIRTAAAAKSVVVPREAVQLIAGETVVFVPKGDGFAAQPGGDRAGGGAGDPDRLRPEAGRIFRFRRRLRAEIDPADQRHGRPCRTWPLGRSPAMIDRIIQLSLHLRGVAVLLMLAVIGYGVWSYIETPRDAFPDISPVMVPVFGRSPRPRRPRRWS